MYGTVARLRLKSGAEAEIRRLAEEYGDMQLPGFVGEYVYRTDDDPGEYYMAVVFESKEAYRANAESPAQHARYQRFRALLEADPEWHDGEVIVRLPSR